MDRTFFKRMSVSEYRVWVEEKEKKLKQVADLTGNQIPLDYSLTSISQLCNWLIKTYNTLKEAHNDDGIRILDTIAVYVGETFIHHFGGSWVLETDDQMYSYGFPGIMYYKTNRQNAIPEYPHSWVTTTIHRRSCFILDRFLSVGDYSSED